MEIGRTRPRADSHGARGFYCSVGRAMGLEKTLAIPLCSLHPMQEAAAWLGNRVGMVASEASEALVVRWVRLFLLVVCYSPLLV